MNNLLNLVLNLRDDFFYSNLLLSKEKYFSF